MSKLFLDVNTGYVMMCNTVNCKTLRWATICLFQTAILNSNGRNNTKWLKKNTCSSSCGTVAFMVLFIFFIFLRTIGLRFSLYQKLSKLRKKSCAAFLPIFVMKSGARTIKHIFRFVRYLSTFFYTYLPINIHFQFIIITNISFVTNPAYFVRHLASPVVSF